MKAMKATRFAALVRVSTEMQEKEGESLRTQRAQITEAVQALAGRIVGWYGGQEHATPGYEKKEIDRLLRDVRDKRFDAVIVAHADRWSRDNGKSQAGLDVFKEARIRFFVGLTEHDLFNPEHVLFLSMSAVFGQFQASNQKKKSLLNRVNRAKRGIPTAGKRPFGRIWTEDNGWVVDRGKQLMIEDVAKRYLAGERLSKLAREYGVNHPNLHKVLMHRSGTAWEMEFHSDELNIHETIQVAIPRLLPDATIEALRRQARVNRTYNAQRHPYLLSRYIYCGHCGYALQAQMNHNGRRYYRHQVRNGAVDCPCQPRPWVRADALEQCVIERLFETFGNPAAVERAIEEATPDLEKIRQLQSRSERLARSLDKIKASRNTVLRLITKGMLTEVQAEEELASLNTNESQIMEELDLLHGQLDHVPDAPMIRHAAEQITTAFKRRYPDSAKVKLNAKIRLANVLIEEMTWEDKRALVKTVFDGVSPDGKPNGVYIHTIDGEQNHRRKRFQFKLRGLTGIDGEAGSIGPNAVIESALYLPGKGPPARRSCGRTLPPAASC